MYCVLRKEIVARVRNHRKNQTHQKETKVKAIRKKRRTNGRPSNQKGLLTSEKRKTVKHKLKNELNDNDKHLLSFIKKSRTKAVLTLRRKARKDAKKTNEKALYKRNYSHLKEKVTEFYNRNSYFDPTKKGQPKKQLDKTGKELHRMFLKETGENISLQSFYRLKPKNIRSLNRINFRQCLCIKCNNPKLKCEKLSKLTKCDIM